MKNIEIYCISIKNINTPNIRCTHHKKPLSEYCGIHGKSKKVIKYCCTDEKEDDIVDEFQKLFKPNVELGGLNKMQQYYNQKATIIQKNVRRFLVMRKKKCINNEDLYTTESKWDIKDNYYFDILSADGNRYFFDIRTFGKIIENPNPSNEEKKMVINPYTTNEISEREINKYLDKIANLKMRGINISFEDDSESGELSDEQKFECLVVGTFHKFDMLGNYTDHRWFLRLSLRKLKELYLYCQDIWNHHIMNLREGSHRNIILSGIAFDIRRRDLLKINSKRKLQEIIIGEYLRFCTEGANKVEKQTGTILMLMGLVRVSHSASVTLPHLL